MTVNEALNAFKSEVGEISGVRMRADDSDFDAYADRYQDRANEEGFDPDWNAYQDLWDNRGASNDAMAELLAETIGVAHDEALAWIEDY